MDYRKPEVTIVGSARLLLETIQAKPLASLETSRPGFLGAPAYDLDG
jgi:hypothetical protein